MSALPIVDQTYPVEYPFVLEDVSVPDVDGLVEIKSWRPGVDYRPVSPEDSEPIAHGIGRMLLTVVSIHKPGRYPTRVFFTRQWQDPNGKRFGKGRLMVKSVTGFNNLRNGYRYPYEVEPPQ